MTKKQNRTPDTGHPRTPEERARILAGYLEERKTDLKEAWTKYKEVERALEELKHEAKPTEGNHGPGAPHGEAKQRGATGTDAGRTKEQDAGTGERPPRARDLGELMRTYGGSFAQEEFDLGEEEADPGSGNDGKERTNVRHNTDVKPEGRVYTVVHAWTEDIKKTLAKGGEGDKTASPGELLREAGGGATARYQGQRADRQDQGHRAEEHGDHGAGSTSRACEAGSSRGDL